MASSKQGCLPYVVVASLLGAACSSPATLPSPGADATVSAPDGPTGAADAGQPGPAPLRPISPAPPAVGDGKLPDVPDESVGGSPDGWDLCGSELVSAPRAGKSDPPATRGDRYLLYSSAGGSRAGLLAQAYFYFGERFAAGGKGLWFDLALVSGSATATRLDLYAVDKVCDHPVPLGGFSLSEVLQTPGRWATTCIDLPPGLLLDGLGIRLGAASAEIGIDAFRFGPPCPASR